MQQFVLSTFLKVTIERFELIDNADVVVRRQALVDDLKQDVVFLISARRVARSENSVASDRWRRLLYRPSAIDLVRVRTACDERNRPPPVRILR